jgi:hypothetical protein
MDIPFASFRHIPVDAQLNRLKPTRDHLRRRRHVGRPAKRRTAGVSVRLSAATSLRSVSSHSGSWLGLTVREAETGPGRGTEVIRPAAPRGDRRDRVQRESGVSAWPCGASTPGLHRRLPSVMFAAEEAGVPRTCRLSTPRPHATRRARRRPPMTRTQAGHEHHNPPARGRRPSFDTLRAPRDRGLLKIRNE